MVPSGYEMTTPELASEMTRGMFFLGKTGIYTASKMFTFNSLKLSGI
jgi:hypothetical protein